MRIESKLLTNFWGRPMYLGAVVLLPEGFDDHPEARHPVLYRQGHFHHTLSSPGWRAEPPGAELAGFERTVAEYQYKFYQDWTAGRLPRMLIVEIQHANPYYDDSYGVNSANVGPYGDAIVVRWKLRVRRRPRTLLHRRSFSAHPYRLAHHQPALAPVMVEHMLKTAPPGADARSWTY